MRSAARALVVGVLAVTAAACGSADRTDRAFDEIDGALPTSLRQVAEERGDGYHSARYEVRGEPAAVAAIVRSSLAARGFTLQSAPG